MTDKHIYPDVQHTNAEDLNEDDPPPAYSPTVINGNEKLLAGKKITVHDDEVHMDKISVASDESEDRGQWTGQMDFLMSMVAYAVGLGNVWRFPYLCFKNGGGTFLFVYAIFWCLGAVPVFLLEVTVGQHLQKGGIEVWNICPILKGVGFGNVVIAFMCMWYYCVIVTWAFYYLISSFRGTFPWETCDNWWNTEGCIGPGMNSSLVEAIRANATLFGYASETSVEEYWDKRVLMTTDDIGDFGGMQWELLGLKVFVWVIIYFALWKGITNARKFVYFCAISPYVLLFILLIRGTTLPGAINGIKYYLTPDFNKLLDVTVWRDAGTQVFYSYGVGFGTLIALGSHNKYNHNCYRDAMVLCVINASTSILAGFVVFSILGYMSGVAEKDVSEIVKPGVGLAFLAYPEVAVSLPVKQLWAVLFFIMLSILGIDSQVCMVEGAVTAVEDLFPHVLRRHKKVFLLGVCTFFFLIGIPMVSHAGNHWLTLVDNYGPSGIALLFVVFFEVVGLSWGFGTDRVSNAMQDMLGFRPNRFWIIMWKFGSPLACLVLFIILCVKHEPLVYPGTKTPYPDWALAFGGFLSFASMACIPGYAIYWFFKCPEQGFMNKLRSGFTTVIMLPYKHCEKTKHRHQPPADTELESYPA